jgi:4-amino-4-deoxy-L-arabinose transferase-like glycosyltransferase
MPHYFGEIVYVPLALFLYHVVRQPQASTRAIAAWFVITYVTFSLMATKLPAFVAIAAPALFLAQAHTWVRLRDIASTLRGPRRLALGVLLGLLALLPARYLLEPTGPLERRDRTQALTRQFMTLDNSLGVPQAVIFNVSRPYELMFYSRYDAYGRMPNPDEVAELQRRGIPIYVYQPAGTIVTPPTEWQARILEGR